MAAVTRSVGVSPIQFLLAVGIIAVGAFPSAWYYFRKSPFRFPLFPIAGLYYAICFGLPFLLLDVFWPTGFPEAGYVNAVILPVRDGIGAPNAMVLVLAGIGAFVAVFISLRGVLESRMVGFGFGVQLSPGPFRVLAYAMLAGYMAQEFIPAIRDLPSIGHVLDRIGYVAFAVFFAAGQMRVIRKAEVWAVFGVGLPMVVMHKLFTSLMTPVILFGLLLFILCWPVYKKRAIVILGASALCAALFYFPAQEFRAQIGLPQFKSSAANESLVGKISFFGRISAAVWAKDTEIEFENRTYALTGAGALTAFGRRIFLMPLFNHVYAKTPEPVPYWGGETYRNFFTNLVPRAFWAGKPEERFGREFGIRYGLVSQDDHSSVNVPWIIELLANFGAVGVIAGMAVIGFLFAVIDRFFNSKTVTPIERAVGIGLMFRWAYPESNFTVMCGDLLPLTVACYIYFRFGSKWLAPVFGKHAETPP